MSIQFETMVRTYKSTDDYRKDAAKLAKQGWAPSNVLEEKPRAGCFRILTLGLFALVRPPKSKYVVTYQRSLV